MKGPPPRNAPEAASAEGLILDPDALRAGDRVVYPNQGVCKIVGVESQEIAGQKLELVRMAREEDGAIVLVPKGKMAAIGLRRVATREYTEGVFHYLAAQYDDPELDWKIRHRDNADRLVTGGVLGVAEVVKGLHALSHIRPLPTKEREQYDNARHLLTAEIAAALGVAAGVAEDFVDHALMPPAGVKFQLKAPPKPVTLPVRVRRKPLAKAEDDLGLDDLGIELGEELPALAEGAAVEEAGEAEGEGAETSAAPVPPGEAKPARGAAPKAKAKAKAKGASREKARPAARKPAPARKKEKPAPRKAAPKARKPARGGKR